LTMYQRMQKKKTRKVRNVVCEKGSLSKKYRTVLQF
jgi:hypothetical protein